MNNALGIRRHDRPGRLNGCFTAAAHNRQGAIFGAGLTALGDTRLANRDTAVSTRLAAASYTAPDNTDIVAIKAFVGMPP